MSWNWSVFHILVLLVSALLMAWLLAGWLPGRGFDWRRTGALGVLLSFIVFTLSTLVLFVTGVGTYGQVPTSFGYLSDWPFGGCLGLLFTVPLLAGVDALLYSGGWLVRTHPSRSRVFVGYTCISLGLLLWIGAVMIQVVTMAFHF
jgi:hypothetical protein